VTAHDLANRVARPAVQPVLVVLGLKPDTDMFYWTRNDAVGDTCEGTSNEELVCSQVGDACWRVSLGEETFCGLEDTKLDRNTCADAN